MMLPTLISVSLAPGSYFFCARAGALATITPAAVESNRARRFTRIAASSLFWLFPRSHASDLAVQDRTERLECLALELTHLHLLDRVEVRRAGVDLDARQRHPGFEILQASGLGHDILAREIVAALLQHLHQRARHAVAVHREARGLVALRIVLVHEGEPLLRARIVLPLRIGRVLAVERGQDALRVLDAGGADTRADRCRPAVEQMHGLPANLGGLLDRLRGELRRGHIVEHVRAGGLETDDLRVD